MNTVLKAGIELGNAMMARRWGSLGSRDSFYRVRVIKGMDRKLHCKYLANISAQDAEWGTTGCLIEKHCGKH